MDDSTKKSSNKSIAYSEYSIDEILKKLSWNNSDDIVSTGLILAREVKCIKAFFQPICFEYGKDTWENCSKIICEKTDYELEPYIDDMVRWLQDMNWPGAYTILKRLIAMEHINLLANVLDILVPAVDFIGDEQWLANLANLKQNKKLFSSLKDDTVTILQDYYEI